MFEQGFPRMRGDVPSVGRLGGDGGGFSPHARGCSLLEKINPHATIGFPRMRGDVPPLSKKVSGSMTFSPHARGCSGRVKHMGDVDKVFPACAGMFRSNSFSVNWLSSFPRMRGDVPLLRIPRRRAGRFSPHARGCSQALVRLAVPQLVFPACAGMFRSCSNQRSQGLRFPRMRGDVPLRTPFSNTLPWFSPHARGCSFFSLPLVVVGGVFPACAGMFLAPPAIDTREVSFPRMRGDVPTSPSLRRGVPSFSPHARGCSSSSFPNCHTKAVFPACAGMFRRLRGFAQCPQCFPRMRGDVPGF